MNIRADATFRAGDWSRLEALLVPKLTAGITAANFVVLGAAAAIVPVDTGRLQESGAESVEWKGSAVTGTVQFNAPYAAYVEFGTGRRGSSSAGAGPYDYDQNWPGMTAQPYLRPALDSTRAQVLDAIKGALD